MLHHKEQATVSIAPYAPGNAPPPPSSGPINRSNSRAYKDIALACLTISFPMIVLSGALLGLIYSNRVVQSGSTPSALQIPSAVQVESSAYLVHYSATRLITIASWTSSVAPLLPGFVMTLLSFPAAHRVLKTSQAGQSHRLPTPYQVALYVQLMAGGWYALWHWIKYRFWSFREKQAPVISRLVFGLVFATVIGYAIVAVDTWLHVATSTVLFQQIESASPPHSYGKALYSDDCSKRNDFGNPCTVDSSASQQLLMGANEAYATMNNISSQNEISSFTHNGVSYAFLLPSSPPSNSDFRTTTFALSTQCAPVSRACNMGAAYGASTPFECSKGFFGDATALKDTQTLGYRRAASPIGFTLLSSPAAEKNISTGSEDMNPFFLGTWANVDTQAHLPGTSDTAAELQKDPEIITPVHGGMAWVLTCNATVHDLTYTWLNGSVVNPLLQTANASTGGLIAAPMNEGFALPNLELAAKIASFSSTAQELANKWGDLFSQTALGLSAGVMAPSQNLVEQTRRPILVARVPKAPLFALVGLNLIYAALGILLALYALLFSRVSKGTGAVRQRLTVAGLAAECFEGPERANSGGNKYEEFFVEREHKGMSGRFGVLEGSDGGWRYMRV